MLRGTTFPPPLFHPPHNYYTLQRHSWQSKRFWRKKKEAHTTQLFSHRGNSDCAKAERINLIWTIFFATSDPLRKGGTKICVFHSPPPLRLFVPTVPNKRTYSHRILDNLPKKRCRGDWLGVKYWARSSFGATFCTQNLIYFFCVWLKSRVWKK